VERSKSRRAGRGLFSLTLAITSLATGARAVAQSVPTDQLFALTIPVIDINAPVGTVSARIGRTGDYRIPTASLLPILERIYSAGQFAALRARLEGLTEIGPGDAARLHLPIRFDAARVALILEPAPGDRAETLLEIGRSSRAPEAGPSRHAPEALSGYLNMSFGVVDDPTLGIGRTRGTLLLDSAVRLADFVLENSASVEIGGVDGMIFNRQATRLTHDFPEAGIRASVGDLFTSSVGFTGSEDILGISIFKNVDVFDPFQTSRPIGRQSFILSRPSDVDIYVNGALIRQSRLQAGTYNLTNFPMVDGANDVTLQIRDDQGQVRTFAFTSFFDSELLGAGISQWELNVGVNATRFNRQIKYDFNDIVGAGYYRRGVTNALTLGANASYFSRRLIVGAEAIAATPIANISFDLATSLNRGAVGVAGALTFQPLLPRGWLESGRSIDGFAEFATSNFGTNAIGGFGQRLRVGVRYNDLFMNRRLAFSASASYTSTYGGGRDGFEGSMSLGYRFNSDFVLRVTPNYRHSTGGHGEAAVLVSLSKTFTRRNRARLTYETRNNRMLAEYDYQSQNGGIGTIGANATLSRADNEESIVDLAANYVGNRFEGSAGYTHIVSDGRSGDLGRLRASVGTAIAFAGGDFAIGRPVRDSFAIVRPHATLGSRQVVVGPGLNDQGDRARSGALGPALLSDVGSYAISRVPYDVVDLPPGYDLGSGLFEFFPPYHSGYGVTVGSNRLASAIGVILDRDGHPLPLAVGSVTSATDRDFAPQQIFTNRNGRFGITGLVPGNVYLARFSDAGVTVRVEIPATATGFVNVGTIAERGE
jgi:outer membrane usher protein